MALSSQSFTSNGAVSYVDVTIDYYSRLDIRVLYDNVQVFPAEGKWAWVGTTDRRIQFTPSPANGVVVKIQRVTGITSMLHDFSDNAQFTSQNLDENFVQLLDAVQEITENGTGGSGPSPGDIHANQVSFVPSGSNPKTNVQEAIDYVQAAGAQPAVSAPLANSVAAQIGTSARFAREDHVHPSSGGSGEPGTPGLSNAQVLAYKRATSVPPDNPGDATWNFAVGKITLPSSDALANGWTKTIPTGTDPLYVTAASASSSASTDTIAANEWATPVRLVENGSNGANGLNIATVYIYQRGSTSTPPALPSANVTYTFSTSATAGLTNGWATTVPASGGSYLFVSTATAVSNTATDIITPSEWATVQIMAKDGLQGSPGATGSNGVDGRRGTLTVYQGGQTIWSDTVATNAVQAVGLGGPYDRDVVTEYGTNFSQTKFYSGGVWNTLTAVIDGNLLVTGTVSAAKINGGTLTGVTIKIGSGSTPSGGAFEVTAPGVLWADNLVGKQITIDNGGTANAAIVGVVSTGSKAGVQGQVAAANSSGAAGGVYGLNSYNGTAGIIGPNAAAYDFYATGTGTNFGPFTGAHDALTTPDTVVELGDIMVDQYCVSRGHGVSNTIFCTALSNAPKQAAAIGVVATPPKTMSLEGPPAAFIVGFDADFTPIIDPEYADAVELYLRCAVNAVGEGVVNVVGEGGNIQAGDLIITSSVPGKGMRSPSDLQDKWVVAKARESVTFVGNEVKQVACIYLCG